MPWQEEATDSAEEDAALVAEYQHRLQHQQSGETGLLVAAPAVCQQAVGARRAEQLAIALTYENAEVTVELVDQANLSDPPGKFLSSSFWLLCLYHPNILAFEGMGTAKDK